MNSVTLVAFLIFTSASRGGSTSYSDFTEMDAEDFQNEFVEDEVAYAPNSEDSTQSQTIAESFQTNPPDYHTLLPGNQRYQRAEVYGESSSEEISDFKHPVEDPAPVLSALNEVAVDKHLTHLLVHPFDNQNAKAPFYNEEVKSSQTPKRREIKEWKISDDFFDSNNVPWSVDAYYPRSSQGEYVEDSSYSMNKSPEGPSVIVAGDYKDHNPPGKHPQYFQKNYYYNYYPLVNDRKRWSSEEIYDSDSDSKKRSEMVLGRKFPAPNPCKQYLEFLKYAFERLDENSDYYYEPNEEYAEEWREPEKSHKMFGTQLLGPTFYIDNSGKISQINTKGNSVQVAEGISPESRVSIFSKAITKTKPFTQEITQSTPLTFPATTEPKSSLNLFHSYTHETGTMTHEMAKHNETETPTPPPYTTQWVTERQPTTTGVWEQTTEEDDYGHMIPTTAQEYYRIMGRPMERKTAKQPEPTTTLRTYPYWFSRSTIPPPTTFHPPTENRIQVKTVLSIENSSRDLKSDDADCKDKMLPCPDTVNITYPLNGYCNRYVSCESGRAIRRTCPEGLHFNLIIKSCDLPHNSFCTYVCPQPNGNFGIPGDCGGYFVCKNSNLEYRMCPPRMHWDINRNSCTFSQLSSCPMKCFRDNEVRHYEGDCKAYIVCLNGIPYYHKCPPHTKFDKISLVCVPDHMANCVDDPRLVTNTLNPNALCKDVQIQLNTSSWCRAFLPFDKQKS